MWFESPLIARMRSCPNKYKDHNANEAKNPLERRFDIQDEKSEGEEDHHADSRCQFGGEANTPTFLPIADQRAKFRLVDKPMM